MDRTTQQPTRRPSLRVRVVKDTEDPITYAALDPRDADAASLYSGEVGESRATVRKIGGRGAYRDLPPSDEEVEGAVATLRAECGDMRPAMTGQMEG